MESKEPSEVKGRSNSISLNSYNYIKLINCKLDHGPIIKNQQTFTMTYKLYIDTFYYVDNHNSFEWKINYQFSHFKDLNDSLCSISSNYIHSEFPISYKKTMIGLKLAPSKLEERRFQLELWMKEVLANFCSFPYSIKSLIENFINVPHDVEKRYHNYLATIKVANQLGLDNEKNQNINYSNSDSIDNNNDNNLSSIRKEIVNIIKNNNASDSNTKINDYSSNTITYHRSDIANGKLPSPLALKIKTISDDIKNYFGIDSTSINTDHGYSPFNLPKICRTQTLTISSNLQNVIAPKKLSLFGHVLLGIYQQRAKIKSYAFIYLVTIFITGHHHLSLWLASVLTYMFIWYNQEIAIDNNDDTNNFKCTETKKKKLREFLKNENIIKYFNKSINTYNNDNDKSDFSEIIANNYHDNNTNNEIISLPESLSSQYRVRGKTVADLEFLDVCENQKSLFEDRQFNHTIQVRGFTFLKDKKKVAAGPSISKLVLLEMYEVEDGNCDRHDHVASRGLAKQRVEAITSLPSRPFVIVINYQLPGDPPVSLVSYFAVPSLEELQNDPRFEGYPVEKWYKLFEKFIDLPNEDERLEKWQNKNGTVAKVGSNNSIDPNEDDEEEDVKANKPTFYGLKLPSDITWCGPESPGVYVKEDFRNARFKLIPNISDGPWVVKAAVRSKPALIGRKVVCRYFKTDTYMELDVNVSSSIIASQIIGVCRGYAKHFTADVGIVIQGESEDELPEMLLSVGSVRKINFSYIRKLEE